MKGLFGMSAYRLYAPRGEQKYLLGYQDLSERSLWDQEVLEADRIL